MSMRTLSPALCGMALSIAGFFSAGCATLESMLDSAPKPTAALKDVHFKNASFTKLDLVFDVDVKNPYSVPLPLLNMDYSLTGGEQRLLSGNAPITGSIPANETKTVSLPAQVSISDVLKFFSGARPGGTLPYNANLKMAVDAPGVGTIPVPISKSGEIKVPSIPGL